MKPLVFTWGDDQAMHVAPFHRGEADKQYVIGQRYRLIEVDERSDASHRHEFAWLKTAWDNLPEQLAAAYPSPEHLRKRALIAAGYCSQTIVDAGSHAAAERVAAGCRYLDEFALVEVRGASVIISRAESQSRRSMGRERFQASKTAIMEIIAEMVGVDPSSLQSKAA